MKTITNGVKEFLSEKGDLHDCRIGSIEWNLEENRLEALILDLNANFAGLPEYSGPQPGFLVFEGIRSIRADISLLSDKLRIYEVSFSDEEGLQAFEFLFYPAGKLVVHSSAISLRLS